MFTCVGCGVVGPGGSFRVYCSNRCQRAYERTLKTALWLETGVAFPSSRYDHYVRVHINTEQSGCCAICGLAEEWNGLPLRFVLDHIDGDSTNNRRENLRLICPNCDSQLPTYKNRNHGRGRHARRARYAAGQSY